MYLSSGMLARVALARTFPIDGPVRPASRMVGRTQDIEDLRRFLAEDHVSVLMADERRTGKTSVALSVLDDLRDAGRTVLDCDLTAPDARTSAALAARLASQARVLGVGRVGRGSSSLPKRIARTLAQRGRDLAKPLTALTGDPDVGSALETAAILICPTDDKPVQLHDVLQAVRIHSLLTDEPVVLFVDELQALADAQLWHPNDGATVEATLASAVRSPEAGQIVLCLAGSEKSLVDKLFAHGRPLSSVGTRYTLNRIPDDDWRAALAERFAEVGCETTPEGLDLLLTESGGHARRTMHVALHAARWARGNDGVVDPMVVGRAVVDAKKSPSW